jgi:AcrR family transcriptional regulator
VPSTAVPGSGPIRRQPPEVRRRMLLDAARTVIAERGLHATTIRDVAAAGEVAVGTVTYHFSGIAEVLAGVLESEMDEWSEPLWAAADAAPDGRTGLSVLLDGLLADGDRAVQHWKLWLDFWALAAHYPQYATWQSQVYLDLHDLAERLLRRGAADGSLVVADPRSAAVQVIALVDGLVVQCYLPEGRLQPAQGRALVNAAAAALMTG